MATSEQGLFFVTSTPKTVASDVFDSWYREEHIPDVLKTSGIKSAFRFKNVTAETFFPSPSTAADEFLALYPLQDLRFLETEEFNSIPVKSKMFGEGEQVVYDVAEFGVRHYSWLHGYEGEKAHRHPSPGRLVISAGMTPPQSQEDDFNLWYEKEHYRTLSECKHYIRTRRYKLVKTVSPQNFDAPKFLTLHEFDCEPSELDAEGLGRSGATEWSQKIMSNLEANEVKVWKGIEFSGEIKAKF